MWSCFLRRKRTPPRKRRPDKRIPPRSFPSWEASSAVFFSLCSSGPVLQANLHTAAELRPLYSRCSWKVCHGKSSKCSVPSGLHWHLENQRSVPHRAADRSYPHSAAPFTFVHVPRSTTFVIVPCTVPKDHCFFDQRYAQKFFVQKASYQRLTNADGLCITEIATSMLLVCNKHN